jgi:pSer/pThr/pTyr-binding forkhead associated (FHA) protein
MAEISIDTGDGSRERFPLANERVTIGRSRDSDIFLPDQWLSRHHAEILRKDAAFYLHDLGSKNGTLLNGEPVHGDRRLRHGDVITLGEHVLTFSIEEAADEDSQPPEGTRIFSARELSDIKTKPPSIPRSCRSRTGCWRS